MTQPPPREPGDEPLGPLAGLRVVDFTTNVAGPYATKLLADHGADVLKVEPPSGDPSRREGPFFQERPHPEGSARFLHLNTNKRGITLDLATDEGVDIAARLAAEVDVVVEDFDPGYLASRGLTYEVLEGQRPGVVLASITPWGQDGPYVGLRQSDLIAQAMGGPMLWTGSAEREPLKLGGSMAHYHAGAVAATAILMAVYRQEVTGEGDHIDLSIYETQAGSRDRAAPYVVNHLYNGMEPKRHASGTTLAAGVRPCADGYVNIAAWNDRRRPPFLRMIGRPDLADDPRLAGPTQAVDPDLVHEVEAAYLGWLMQRTKREVVQQAQEEAHALAGAINTPQDLVEDRHFRERGVWEVIDHPHTGPLEYPGRPFIMGDSPRPPARRAPLLGEHTLEVLGGLGYTPADCSRLRALGVI